MTLRLPLLPEPQKVCWIGHTLFSGEQLRDHERAVIEAVAARIEQKCEQIREATCHPGCNSYGHEEGCPYAFPEAFFKQLADELRAAVTQPRDTQADRE